MRIDEFKDFLKVALLDGYYPINNCHGYKEMSREKIENIIDRIPNLDKEESFLELIDSYESLLDGFEIYKPQYKLMCTLKTKYKDNLYDNYIYGKEKKVVENDKDIYKNDEKCYNKRYKGEDLTVFSIDLKKIKRCLKLTDTTYQELAEILNVSQRSIDRKLSGDTEFKAIELIKIMKVFDLSVDDILKEEI